MWYSLRRYATGSGLLQAFVKCQPVSFWLGPMKDILTRYREPAMCRQVASVPYALTGGGVWGTRASWREMSRVPCNRCGQTPRKALAIASASLGTTELDCV